MKFWTLLYKNILFYRRSHLGALSGAAISTAILIGALVIGDSIRYSLKQLVYDRLGRTEYALQTGERFVRQELADDLSRTLNCDTAPLLQTRGMVIVEGGAKRINQVQVIGVDERFGIIGNCPEFYQSLTSNEIIINQRLADQLEVQSGDQVLIRLENLDAMPKEAPLATDRDLSIARRYMIKHIAESHQFGRYSLQTDQVEPFNVFVVLDELAQALELEELANTILVADSPDTGLTSSIMADALDSLFTLRDAGLKIQPLPKGAEVRSSRIFLDPPVVQRIKRAHPESQPLLTYFINEFTAGGHSTPYSFVSTAEAIGYDLDENEIIINDWLADDLNVSPGSKIDVVYYKLGSMRSLIEDTASFRIKTIVPLRGKFADRYLMPDFPGLAEEENCRDWEAGIPIDYDKIRDKDEAYWDDYRGIPKAFVSLQTTRDLWANRFGNLTAIRFAHRSADSLESALNSLLDPLDLGFRFSPVRQQGIQASENSVDFSQLFIGLSFFLIIAALLLTGLLFAFGVEQRSAENGTFLALGFQRSFVRKVILTEGLVIAVAGGLLGVVLGLLYELGVLYALKTMWFDIVGTSALQLKIYPRTLGIGLGAGVLISLLSMWLVARYQARRAITELQRGIPRSAVIRGKFSPWSLLIGVLCILFIVVILLTTSPGQDKHAAAAFFIAGALALIAGVAFSDVFLSQVNRKPKVEYLTLAKIGQRGNSRRRFQSLTLIGLLAAGVFITFTVGANRAGSRQPPTERSSGTGGFALWAESSLPIIYDLNSEKGKAFYQYDDPNVAFVPFKKKQGDDASCLNLHRISTPTLLAVEPDLLAKRNAFSAVKALPDVDLDNPWGALQEKRGDVIPGIADQTVIVWGLGKDVGDTLTYVDEHGRDLNIRLIAGLASSVFQGHVMIDENYFNQHYPSSNGHFVFLIDTPRDSLQETAEQLRWTFQDQGLTVQDTDERLAEFNKVNNTYLSIFMILGGLGLVLGSLGIGIVLVRNVLARRGELALMRALGFQQSMVKQLILSEHLVLLASGIGWGALAAFLAVLPALMTPGSSIPYATIIFTFVLVMGSGILWTILAAQLALRGDLIPALRNE